MIRPYPKPEKKEKKKPQAIKKKPIKTKRTQRYRTSNGELLTDTQISTRLTKAYSDNVKPNETMCECCHVRKAEHHDHSISQRMCKLLKLVDLIWNVLNWSLSCAICHHEWESYKSGKFTNHYNFLTRMRYLKEHDPEGFRKRMNYVTDLEQIKELK